MTKHLVVITGATAGTGLALVKRYIEDGHIVVGCGRNEAKINELNETHSSNGHMFRVLDIRNKDDVKEFADEVINLKGAPEFLINNAGVGSDPVEVVEMPIELFENIIDINVKGTFYVTHCFLPAMIKARQGIIINFTSGWGRQPGKGQGPYCCSKFGLEGFSKVLALELPPPMACVPLNPGVIGTKMLVKGLGMEFAKAQRSPDQWATEVGDFILNIDRNSNGESLTAPGFNY